jgi:predicted transcriptional regulator
MDPPNITQQNVNTPQHETTIYAPDLDLSYEDIADEFKELGETEFNKKYPGWKTQMAREMGLDAFNSMFYNLNEEPEDYKENLERLEQDIEDEAADIVYNILNELENVENPADKIIQLYNMDYDLIKSEIKKLNINYLEDANLNKLIKDNINSLLIYYINY